MKSDTQNCICSALVPVCQKCGRKWDYYTDNSDGTRTHTSKQVVAKYEALYSSRPNVKPVGATR